MKVQQNKERGEMESRNQRRIGHANLTVLQYRMRHAQPALQSKCHNIEV